MTNRHVESLNEARQNFVRKRRAMAEQMVPDGAAAAHFAPAFADLQAAIEAIDRAIADETKLPGEYAAATPSPDETSAMRDGSNVEHVDFEQSS